MDWKMCELMIECLDGKYVLLHGMSEIAGM